MREDAKRDAARLLEEMYRDDPLPVSLSGQYSIVSCLKKSGDKSIYMLEDRSGNGKVILKRAARGEADTLQEEYHTLCMLDVSFVPKAIRFVQDEAYSYLVREYIPGETLEQLVEREGPLPPKDAVDALLAVCDHVYALHSRVPPLIHRDIKPQNMIRTPQGAYKLIDMGTVRSFKETARLDTVCIGTRETAAPEQFGYRQTSTRSDIYSLGVLLLYLLTGSYTLGGEEQKALPASLRAVVKKCTEFDPQKRYATAVSLKKDLVCIRRFKVRRKPLLALAGVLCLLFAAAIGALAGPISRGAHAAAPLDFENPRIEAAVYQALGTDASAHVYPEDISELTTLVLCGSRVFGSWQEHQDYHDNYWFEFEQDPPPDGPCSFADLKNFPSLTTLVLDNQGVTDLSVLDGLTLQRLSVQKNQIADLSPLSAQTSLTTLWMSENPVETLEPLSKLPALTELLCDGTGISTLEPLSGLPLELLDCKNTMVRDYSILPSLERLVVLRVSGVDSETVSAISELNTLEMLGLFDSELTGLEAVSPLNRLECLDVGGCRLLRTLDGLDAFPRLNYLGLADTGVEDISAVETVSTLEMLDISRVPVSDLTPLLSCPRLHTVFIDAGKEEIVRDIPFRQSVERIVTDS